MGFCNSCGRPIVKEDYGTNEDGSLNPEFCKDCFQDGKYIEVGDRVTPSVGRVKHIKFHIHPRSGHAMLQ